MIATRKTYYSISEVCSQTGLEPHVLRYWESEFPQLRPKKNRAGNRAYRDKDIEIIGYIKHLLYEEQFTIPGAKKKLAESREPETEQPKTEQETAEQVSADEPLQQEPSPVPQNGQLQDIKRELSEILDFLKSS